MAVLLKYTQESVPFSRCYAEARDRFRKAVHLAGGQLESYSIDARGPHDEELTLDVAICGATHPKQAVVVSSGIHGTEGFSGSAIQLGLLEQLWPQLTLPEGTAIILLHAVNPYGFAHYRRCNEDNIDLNRNFLLPAQSYEGNAQTYAALDAFLNPRCPPSRFEPFMLKALGAILRYGMTTLVSTLPIGQYHFPKGLFFGGEGPSQIQKILSEQFSNWLRNTVKVIHLDLHTGLGKWGDYTLLLDASLNESEQSWLRQGLGADRVKVTGSQGDSYACRGSFGPWCCHQLLNCRYGFVTVEFGTYSMLHMLKALRAENQAYWWDIPGHPSYEWAKAFFLEASAPSNLEWRMNVVSQGLELINRAVTMLIDE